MAPSREYPSAPEMHTKSLQQLRPNSNYHVPTYHEFRAIMRRSKRSSNKSERAHRSLPEMPRPMADMRKARAVVSERAVLNIPQLNASLAQKQRIFCQNLKLLNRLNDIQRLHGYVDSFNRTSYVQHDCYRLKQFLAEVRAKNKVIGCRLLGVRSMIDTRNRAVAPPEPLKRDAPVQTLQEYRRFMPDLQRGEQRARALLRPLIYFDLAVKNRRPLGRIVIQLYTEVSPEVVLEFVNLATYNDVAAHRFLRIFPDLWLEGELQQRLRDMNQQQNHYSPSPLDPSQQAGVLSYAWDYRHDFPHGLLNYTISFKPLAAVPLRRVVFGRLFSGERVLQCSRDFGTKNGKTKQTIEVTRCGLL